MKRLRMFLLIALLCFSFVFLAAPAGVPDFVEDLVCGIMDTLRGAGIPIPEGIPPFCSAEE